MTNHNPVPVIFSILSIIDYLDRVYADNMEVTADPSSAWSPGEGREFVVEMRYHHVITRFRQIISRLMRKTLSWVKAQTLFGYLAGTMAIIFCIGFTVGWQNEPTAFNVKFEVPYSVAL